MSKYYNHISKTPMSVFMDCLCDGELKSLIIEGDVDAYILQGAWMELQEQYAEYLGNTEQRLYLKMLQEVNVDIATLSQVQTLIEVMRNYYCEPMGRLMNKLIGLSLPWSGADRPKINQLLDQCQSRTTGMEMKIDLKKISLDHMEVKLKSKGNNVKPTRDYFGQMFNVIEEVLEVRMEESITVSRYCDRVRRLQKRTSKKRR